MKKIVIIGGGIAGLSAAYHLLKNEGKFDVTVLEKNDYVGGRMHTFRLKDSYIDLGGFMVFPFYKELRTLIHELGLTPNLKPFTSDTKWYQLERGGPLTEGKNIPIANMIPLSLFWHVTLPMLERKVDFYEPDFSLFERETGHGYYKEHAPLSYKKSETLATEIFEAYTYTSMPHIPMTLCVSIAGEQVLHSLFKKCEYIEGGTGTIIDRLAKEVERTGGVIQLKTEVEDVAAGKIHLTSGKTIKADSIIFASLPSPKFLKKNFIHGEKVFSTHFFTVVVEMEHDTNIENRPWFAIYCSLPQNRRSPHIAGIAQCASMSNLPKNYLIAYISIHKNDMHTYDIDALKELCRNELKRFFPNNAVRSIFASMEWQHSIPVIDIDLLEELRAKQGQKDFYYAGDYTGIPCMEIATYSGRRTAEKIQLL